MILLRHSAPTYVVGSGRARQSQGVNRPSPRNIVAGGAASFFLNFDDLGAGVVNTTPGRGGVAATFTRATTATTVLSNGLIGSVASGSPRSYYDPTSLAYLGYLPEGARTNLCLQSEDFSTTWLKAASVTVTANTTAAPDGNTTADTITGDTTLTDSIFQDITGPNGSISVSYSFFAKKGTSTAIRVLYKTNGAVSTVGLVDIDWSSAVPVLTPTNGIGTLSNVTAQSFPNGWYRIIATATGTFTTDTRFEFQPSRNADSSTIILWGAQVEQAAFASSYIPTTTVAVTRNADVLTYPTSPWLNASAGTFFAQMQFFNAATNFSVLEVDDTTINERYTIGPQGITFINHFQIIDGGVSQADVTSGSAVSSNTTYKVAAAYAANDAAISANGNSVGADSSLTLPTVTRLSVGSSGAGGLADFGPIRRVTYAPRRLSNAALQAYTS